jgi:hypothetical protein
MRLNSVRSQLKGSKGKRSINKIVSRERGQTITDVCCMSASGTFVPPAIIFSRKKDGNRSSRRSSVQSPACDVVQFASLFDSTSISNYHYTSEDTGYGGFEVYFILLPKKRFNTHNKNSGSSDTQFCWCVTLPAI